MAFLGWTIRRGDGTAIINGIVEIPPDLVIIGDTDQRRAHGIDGNWNTMGAQGSWLRVLQL
jgi:hypothetical protein